MVRLKYLRKQLGITQKQLAAKLGVSQTALSNWESSNRMPETSTLIELAKFFHVSIDYLLGIDSEFSLPPNPPPKEDDKTELLNKPLKELILLDTDIVFLNGKPLDDDTKQLLIKSIKTSLKMAKIMTERRRNLDKDD